MHKAIPFSYLSIALNTKGNCIFLAYLILPSVHDDRSQAVTFINDKQVFRYNNNTVSDYFHLKTEETKSGKALASLFALFPTPFLFMYVY